MRLVERVSNRLGRFSRRGFLVRTAVVGSAIVVDPRNYVLTPMTASAAVGCGPAASCSAGYTVMCCTINKGVNACPPGTFTAGWWKAADSSWCCGGYRYITDCNATLLDVLVRVLRRQHLQLGLLELQLQVRVASRPATSAGSAATPSATASATPR